MGRRALREVRGHARAGRVVFEAHAIERLEEFDLTRRDVIAALANATSCRSTSRTSGYWRVCGPDTDGVELVVIVAVVSSVVVVTVVP